MSQNVPGSPVLKLYSKRNETLLRTLHAERPVHNTTLNYALRWVVFTATLVETQHNARIDSDPILAFPCVAFLRLVVKEPPTFLVINLCVSRINATQGLASLCEPALKAGSQYDAK